MNRINHIYFIALYWLDYMIMIKYLTLHILEQGMAEKMQ